jgi:hypothetical protein
MSDFTRALYAELFDANDSEELDHAMHDWSLASHAERSFAQVQLLWLIHGQLAELTAETTTLSEVLRRLQSPPDDILEVETIDAEVVDD